MESTLSPDSTLPPLLVMATVWGAGSGPLLMALKATLAGFNAMAGARVTVTCAEAVRSPLVAVMVAMPSAWPETMPAWDTGATPALLVAQVILAPMNGTPARSKATAVSLHVRPMTTEVVSGAMIRLATSMRRFTSRVQAN